MKQDIKHIDKPWGYEEILETMQGTIFLDT